MNRIDNYVGWCRGQQGKPEDVSTKMDTTPMALSSGSMEPFAD